MESITVLFFRCKTDCHLTFEYVESRFASFFQAMALD